MPSSRGKPHRQVGDGVGWVLGFGTVSWCSAQGVRRRRGATEDTSHARGSTLSHPSLRWGVLTNRDETNNRGAVRHRKSPATCAGPVSATMTSVSRHAPASIVGPRTEQAWAGVSRVIAWSAARTWAWLCHAMAVSGVLAVGRPVPASHWCAVRGADSR
jgi:hypothetical protein